MSVGLKTLKLSSPSLLLITPAFWLLVATLAPSIGSCVKASKITISCALSLMLDIKKNRIKSKLIDDNDMMENSLNLN